MLPEYSAVLPTIRAAAREHGYAIGLHGSTVRDLDLIAAPWTENASPPAVLVEAVRAAINGVIVNDVEAEPGNWVRRNPQPKSHGRLAWAIYIEGQRISTGGAPYIDLSVMPLQAMQEKAD